MLKFANSLKAVRIRNKAGNINTALKKYLIPGLKISIAKRSNPESKINIVNPEYSSERINKTAVNNRKNKTIPESPSLYKTKTSEKQTKAEPASFCISINNTGRIIIEAITARDFVMFIFNLE